MCECNTKQHIVCVSVSMSNISGLLRKQAQHLFAKLSSKYAFMTPPFLNVNIDCVNFLN